MSGQVAFLMPSWSGDYKPKYMLTIIYIFFMFFLLAQGLLVMYLNLYIWLDKDRIETSGSPKKFIKPKGTFTLMLPAYKEEEVLGDTIKLVAKQNYPKNMYEILVILQPSDKGTIKVARKAIKDAKIKNAKILIVDPDHTPLNKPYQLNYALEHTKFETLVIFDSEDEVHPNILNVANTLYQESKADIIQCGVQLMDYDSTWFAAHNVLEYYFWFKSRMHAHMKVGAVPLGGNTVFFRTQQVRDVGGWNENCLCEDADIGIRLSLEGAKMQASYDPYHVTKEETPHTIEQFVKQRTRWCQGFIQILRYGHWRKLGSPLKVAMAVYLLGSPFLLVGMLLLGIAMAFIGQFAGLPFAVSILSFVPLLLVLSMILLQMAALYDFVQEQKLPVRLWVFVAFPLTFIPYIMMLCAGALRATWREIKGQSNWEKTDHSGAHRKIKA